MARPRTGADQEATPDVAGQETPEAEGQEAPTKEAQTPTQEAEQQEPQGNYTVERLLTDGDALLGYPPHVIAGALHGSEPDEEMSVSAAKQKVEEFLGQESLTDASDETEA